ncbi:diguanylate cyclase (GGDEF) domain-containing protein [Kosakonia oryzendophytica]|uniref:diguanylate cyclase n=1 Tax=Kosakonia oryzendophytica TaxID=1005665 RepID=A0A1C4CZ96_9ENTR|nr:GGDEF domain-containing protein [Kosakonia oryzendophytica]TDT59696.1 diguanylate cyclase (GGDEF)-like protein [Enterobacter sp. AG5470]SCC24376.1 diguanylate cyclase (GGDEF) domain-containing protein [Kosakonia oryzendophytica]
MRSLFSTPFRPFQEEKPLNNAAVIFLLTTLFYFLGAMMRLVEELSLFWPLNAVMAGVFARYAFLHRWQYYLISYIAMLAYDAITTSWGTASLIINFSNMVFIITMVHLITLERNQMVKAPEPVNALRLFGYCMFAALLCAFFGAVGSVGINGQGFLQLLADWFSEQFSTGVLILPGMLTMSWPREPLQFKPQQLLPIGAVIVSVLASVVIGGAGSLAFPLPALIWCAVVYPLPLTSLVTLLTGGAEIMLVANGAINIFVGSPMEMPHMFSARLGIATLAICPVIVSVSVAKINRLIRQVSLRADFDFLTRVYSRSGLYEALNNDDKRFADKHVTVMLMDIDYFKSVNDNYGHECGDRVLAAFARKVQEALGERGIVARMGGEEFVVVAITADPDDGFTLAEKVRHSIEHYPFKWRQQTLHLTVSIGLSSGLTEAWALTEMFNELLAEADENLYRSKKQGRNCTTSSKDIVFADAPSQVSSGQ